MRVFMVGWEPPAPYNTGGLGTACFGMSEGLVPHGVDVSVVIPEIPGPLPESEVGLYIARNFAPVGISQHLTPSPEEILEAFTRSPYWSPDRTSKTPYSQVEVRGQQLRHVATGATVTPNQQSTWYAAHVAGAAEAHPDFDVVHAHDWMTYAAGAAAKEVAATHGHKVPFIVHVHATEYDRCGANTEGGHPEIIALEKAGLKAADHVIAVSHFTKKVLHRQYGVPLSKISVVHNGVPKKEPKRFDIHELKKHYKIVGTLGRVTLQKGPEQFLQVAKAVCEKDETVRFLMFGSGDMQEQIMEMAARIGLTGKLLFAPFVRGTDIDKAYQMADVFMMPSVSEPFGIVALEAIQNGVPVIVSKQSGASEVSDYLLKVDFWDIDKMTETVLHLLHNQDVRQYLVSGAKKDLEHLGWDDSARKLIAVYNQVLSTVRA